MDKQSEKNILQEIYTKLSSIGKKEEVKEVEEVVEAELSEVEAKEVEEVKEEVVEVEMSKEEAPNYVTKEELESFKTELTSIFKEFAGKVSEEKEELKKEVTELSAQPSAEAIVHAPEMKEDKGANFSFSQNRPKGTFDVVLESLNKYN